MKESLWGYYLVLLGITVSTVMILVSNMTTSNQQNYYLLKEVTNAAMIDAIDYGYYRAYGEMKINKEKFVENFLRRFSEGISKNKKYKVDFYSIYENPPSVSIKVTTNTGDYNIAGDTTNINVSNSIDAIMESNNTIVSSQIYSDFPYAGCDESNYISNNPNDDNYGYCRLMVRLEFNVDNQETKFIKDMKDKLRERYNNIDTEFDLSKVKVLNSAFLHIYDKENFEIENNLLDDKFKMNSNVDVFENTGFGYTNESVYAFASSLNDITGIGAGEDIMITTNIKNVKLAVIKDEEINKFYLAYGFDYSCKNNAKDTNEEPKVFKTYRKILDDNGTLTIYYIDENTYNSMSVEERNGYEKAPYYDNCMMGIKYKVDFYYDTNS